MDLILATKDGNDICSLVYTKSDFSIGNTNDFEITISLADWNSNIKFGCRVYAPKSEIGGIIGGIKTDTATDTITLTGYTWRGLLKKKVISPPANEAYKKVSGDLNDILSQIIGNNFNDIIRAKQSKSGISITYQFDRYTDMLSGFSKMLLQKNYKLKIEYIQQEQGAAGFVEVSAVPIFDYSKKIELSQDSQVNFISEQVSNACNHLISLGKGELTDREVIHLYADRNGVVSNVQTFFGIDEVCETYENVSSENLKEDALKEFDNRIAKSTFKMDIASLGIDVDIGDIVGGRDYITGISAKKPLYEKIITTENGLTSIQYNLEGNE